MKVNFVFDTIENGVPLVNIFNHKIHDCNFDEENIPYYYRLNHLYLHEDKVLFDVNNVKTSEVKNIDGINIYPIFINLDIIYPWPILYLNKRVIELVNEGKLYVGIFYLGEKYDVMVHEHFINNFLFLSKSVGIQRLSSILMVGDSFLSEEQKKHYYPINQNAPQYICLNIWERLSLKYIKQKFGSFDFLSAYKENLQKPYDFLFMNNNTRVHRYFFYKYLEYKKLFNDSLVSYCKPSTLLDYKNSSYYQQALKDVDFFNHLRANPNIEIKLLDIDTKVLSVSETLEQACLVDPGLILNSNFSVYTEHLAMEHWQFITEKTYKLFLYCHPFIAYGQPNLLNTLHKLGYQTFNELFDESYDTMDEGIKKISFIANQVQQYCTTEGREKFKKLLPSVFEKLEYNRNVILNKNFNEVWSQII